MNAGRGAISILTRSTITESLAPRAGGIIMYKNAICTMLTNQYKTTLTNHYKTQYTLFGFLYVTVYVPFELKV